MKRLPNRAQLCLQIAVAGTLINQVDIVAIMNDEIILAVLGKGLFPELDAPLKTFNRKLRVFGSESRSRESK